MWIYCIKVSYCRTGYLDWAPHPKPNGHKQQPLKATKNALSFWQIAHSLQNFFFLSCPSGFSKIEHKRLLENQWHCNFLVITVEPIHFLKEIRVFVWWGKKQITKYLNQRQTSISNFSCTFLNPNSFFSIWILFVLICSIWETSS